MRTLEYISWNLGKVTAVKICKFELKSVNSLTCRLILDLDPSLQTFKWYADFIVDITWFADLITDLISFVDSNADLIPFADLIAD